MERNEVSIHEVKLFHVMRSGGPKWITSKDAAVASGIAERTARAHLLKLTRMGLVELAEVFPAHRYRMAEKAEKRNGGYFRRLEAACDVFGVKL